jgi:hypothetical protein
MRLFATLPTSYALLPCLKVRRCTLTSLHDRLMNIGANLVIHARYATFQVAEVAVPRAMLRRILANIAELRRRAPARC